MYMIYVVYMCVYVYVYIYIYIYIYTYNTCYIGGLSLGQRWASPRRSRRPQLKLNIHNAIYVCIYIYTYIQHMLYIMLGYTKLCYIINIKQTYKPYDKATMARRQTQ